jgi:hypothetical protein
MAGIIQRLPLFLLALALAVAPLRGALAQNPLSAAPSESHCSQMTHGMPAPGNPHGKPAMSDSRDSGHDCSRGCSGSCCGGACNCVHAAAAIPAVPGMVSFFPAADRYTPANHGFTQRSPTPPFRPPVSAGS